MACRRSLVLAASFAALQIMKAGANLQTVLAVDAPERQPSLLEELMEMDTKNSKLDDEPSLPINSAGEHHGTQKVIDVILLFICLLVPFVLFAFIRMYERAQKARETSKEDSSGKGVARLQSSYNMEPAQSDVKLTSAIGPGGSDKDEGTVLSNALAGFSTAMAALPDAISFSFITGVSPLNGIWAGVFMGLSAALVGGRPGMISSASAATAVVLAHISTDPNYGMGPMALCVFFVGILQLIAGALRLSRFITLIPHPVMLGFVNGLAIVMIRAQMRQFHQHGDGPWVERPIVISMTITALFAMGSAMLWARIPYAKKVLPAPLASVVLTAVFSIIFKGVLPRRTLRDVAGSHTFSGGINTMPSWDFPPAGVDWHDHTMLPKVISTAIRFAIVGLLESLMTEALIDQITGTSGSARMECFGQGVGNILSSLFGTQGGCALIAQSLMNVGSGGRTRVSGVVMGLTLGLCVVLLAPLMAEIPVAALVGLICLIALNTFAWGSLELIWRVNWIDSTVVVLVTAVTVWQDLCVAVVIGVVINSLGFAWTAATEVKVDVAVDDAKSRTFTLRGPLFFGSAMNYTKEVDPIRVPEETVVLDFTQGRVLDISGVDAIAKARENLAGAGKKVILRGVPSEALRHLPEEAQEEVTAPGEAKEKIPEAP